MQYEKEIVLYCCWSVSCSELPPFVLLSSVASSVGNKECPAEFQSSAGRFAIKYSGRDIVSGNQFLILFCISSTDGNCLLRSSGRQLVSFLNMPIAHGAVRKLIQEDHSVSPRNLCNSLLHKFFIRIRFHLWKAIPCVSCGYAPSDYLLCHRYENGTFLRGHAEKNR